MGVNGGRAKAILHVMFGPRNSRSFNAEITDISIYSLYQNGLEIYQRTGNFHAVVQYLWTGAIALSTSKEPEFFNPPNSPKTDTVK